MNTTQSYLPYIVNLIALQIFLYIYVSLFPAKTKIKKEKKFKNNSTVPPIENLEFVDAIDSSFEGGKKKKKIPKIGKKRNLKANHLSLALTKPRDTVRVRVKIVGQGTERIGASIPLYPPLNGRYSEEAGSI